jgi:hypothetical protein
MSYQNLIGLLEHSAPKTLLALRGRYPDAGALLSSSRELGDAEAITISNRRAALIDLILAGASNVKADSERLAYSIHDRMKAISRMKFFGALVAVLSGGLGALLTTLGVASQWISTVGPLAGMLGGVVGLVADQFERSPSGVRIAALDEYGKLLDMIGEIDLIRNQIERDEVLPLPDEQLRSMLDQLDKFALTINRLRRA